MAVTLTTDADAALGSITLNSTANLTGSGEVIQRPASVIKERCV